MKSIKKFMVLMIALVMVLSFTACGGNEASEPQEDQSTAAVQPEDIFAVVNGQEVRLGDAYEDIKASLGDEAKPEDVVEPCGDDTTDWLKTIHYYNGVSIHHNIDGIVEHIDINTNDVGEGDVTFMGKIKLGDSIEDIKALLGEPREEDEWAINYMIGDVFIYILRTDEGSDTIGEIDFHPDGVI